MKFHSFLSVFDRLRKTPREVTYVSHVDTCQRIWLVVQHLFVIVLGLVELSHGMECIGHQEHQVRPRRIGIYHLLGTGDHLFVEQYCGLFDVSGFGRRPGFRKGLQQGLFGEC